MVLVTDGIIRKHSVLKVKDGLGIDYFLAEPIIYKEFDEISVEHQQPFESRF